MTEVESHRDEFLGTDGRVRDAQAIDAMSEEELSAWEGLEKEHTQRAVESLTGSYISMALTPGERELQQRSTLSTVSLTCHGSYAGSDNNDSTTVIRLVTGALLRHTGSSQCAYSQMANTNDAITPKGKGAILG